MTFKEEGMKLTVLLGLEVSWAPTSTSTDLVGLKVVFFFLLSPFPVNNSEIGKNNVVFKREK